MKTAHALFEELRDQLAATPLAQKLWARYETAAPREQLALRALGGFLLLLLLLVLLILPLHHFNAGAISAYRAQQETLAWMQANRGAIGGTTQKARAPGDSLLSLASQSARNFGIVFKRYEPKGEKGLNLWLEQVPFNQLVRWLDALERDYGIVPVEITASRRAEAGLVDVRLNLQG